jgi:hypothetical protein
LSAQASVSANGKTFRQFDPLLKQVLRHLKGKRVTISWHIEANHIIL